MGNARKIIAVYQIRNVVNGKYYIGSSTNLYERWRNHRKKLRAGTHINRHLQASWNAHGEDCFSFAVLKEFTTADEVGAYEQELLHEYWGDPLLYNLTEWAGAPGRGKFGPQHWNYGRSIMSEEAKERLRTAARLQWASSDPRTGKKHSPEIRAMISNKVQIALSEGRGGKFIPSEETRKKMSASLKGNQCAKGHIRTPEERKAISERVKGNQNFLGKTHSTETRRKLGRPIKEITEDRYFYTINEAVRFYGIRLATLRRSLTCGAPISRGPFAGLHFVYA